MKLSLKTIKPRNPFMATSLRRSAGAHRPGSQRQQAERTLRHELRHLEERPGRSSP